MLWNDSGGWWVCVCLLGGAGGGWGVGKVEVRVSGVALIIVGGTLYGVALIVSSTLIFLCVIATDVSCVSFVVDTGYGNVDVKILVAKHPFQVK